MATFLMLRGLEPVEITGITFNGARERIDQALTGTKQDGTKSDDKVRNKPGKKLTFKTLDDDGTIGRISFNPDVYIAVGSDQEKDGGEGDPNAFNRADEDDEDEEGDE